MRDRTLFFGSVFDAADVTDLHRRAVDICDHQLFHLARLSKSPERAQNQFALAGLDVAARHIGILPDQSIANGGDGNLVGGQPFRVDPDIDRALQSADHVHLADALGALQLRANHLCRRTRSARESIADLKARSSAPASCRY